MDHANLRMMRESGGGPALLGRAAELARLRAAPGGGTRLTLLAGAPHVGKTAVLQRLFTDLFAEGLGVAPAYYAFASPRQTALEIAGEFLATFLNQFLAFRRGAPERLAAPPALSGLLRGVAPEDERWVRGVVNGFLEAAQAGDEPLALDIAAGAPQVAAAHTRVVPHLLLDNFHKLAGAGLASRFLRRVAAPRLPFGDASGAVATTLCGLRRPLSAMLPADEDLFADLEILRLEPLPDDLMEQVIRARAAAARLPVSDSTVELMVHQLGGDLFYTGALLDAAARRAAPLKTFMEFERLYTEEVLNGRLGLYFDALLRELAPEAAARRAALGGLRLLIEAGEPVPADALLERLGGGAPAEDLLARLHAREFLDIERGFVRPPADAVLADYVRTRFGEEVTGQSAALAGHALLADRLKASYRLMMSRFERSTRGQLVELLARLDFQNVPLALLDSRLFESRFRGASRVQARRALGDEPERLRMPQIVHVGEAGAGEAAGAHWQLLTATGFEGGIYSETNETLWLVALVNAREPLDVELLDRLHRRLELAGRQAPAAARRVVWFVSKEGFTAAAADRLAGLRAYSSTFTQLDLLRDFILQAGPPDAAPAPASQFELVIPIEEDAELIAARTVEQIARAADFDAESINQMKTALIEACINAAEHGDSPDHRIHQRFALADDRMVITVSNKGRNFGALPADNGAAPRLRVARGRGLQIIRALMDDVRFERTDDGTSIVMTKYFKRPEKAGP